MRDKIVVLGVFVADVSFRADRPPRMGETIMGNSFALGPGGKGSNQAVAAAKLGAEVYFVAKLGNDVFAEQSLANFKKETVNTKHVIQTGEVVLDDAADSLLNNDMVKKSYMGEN